MGALRYAALRCVYIYVISSSLGGGEVFVWAQQMGGVIIVDCWE